MGKFQPGNPYGRMGGRPVGAKSRLRSDFLNALAEDFAEHGKGVIRIARIEDPIQYLKVIAGLMPRELLMGTAVSDYDDETLERLAERLRREIEQEQEPMKLIEAKAVDRV